MPVECIAVFLTESAKRLSRKVFRGCVFFFCSKESGSLGIELSTRFFFTGCVSITEGLICCIWVDSALVTESSCPKQLQEQLMMKSISTKFFNPKVYSKNIEVQSLIVLVLTEAVLR